MVKDKDDKGLIYVLVNPSFPNIQKIGMTTDLQKRLKDLNQDTCLPYSFRVLATYHVEENLKTVEQEIHNIIDAVDYSLRTREETDSGKKREREFFEIDRESACSILESISKLRGDPENLELRKPTGKEIQEEKEASQVESGGIHQRGEMFTFSRKSIPIGSIIHFTEDEKITAVIVGDSPPMVSFEGKNWRLSSLVKELKRRGDTATSSEAYQGAAYFTYKGKRLIDLPDEE